MTDKEIGVGCGIALAIALALGVAWVLWGKQHRGL